MLDKFYRSNIVNLLIKDDEIKNNFGRKPWHWVIIIPLFVIFAVIYSVIVKTLKIDFDNPRDVALYVFFGLPLIFAWIISSLKLGEIVQKKYLKERSENY